MKRHFLALASGLVVAMLAIVVVVAWIKGGPRPTQLIEQPVTPPAPAP